MVIQAPDIGTRRSRALSRHHKNSSLLTDGSGPDLAEEIHGPPLRISMMGIRGIPARYGGFETAVEEIGKRLTQWGNEVTVYCRNLGSSSVGESEYLGMRLIKLPFLPVKQLETLSHTFVSIRHQARHREDVDAVLIFNAANGFLLPFVRQTGIPVAVNTDGIEWMRGKWGPAGRKYYRLAEGACVRYADRLISDSRGIQDYYSGRYGTRPEFIPYGAAVLERGEASRLVELGLEPQGYHLVVARLEPENNVEMIVDGFRKSASGRRLVIVGGNPYDPTIEQQLRLVADGDDRVLPLGSLWDQELLDQLYANSATYIHGHSVGGTNPSLLRAMGAGTRVLAFDSRFNREVLLELGSFFASSESLAAMIDDVEADPFESESAEERSTAVQERIRTAYNWDSVAASYLAVCRQLVAQRTGALTSHR